jgi:hypothetical protein
VSNVIRCLWKIFTLHYFPKRSRFPYRNEERGHAPDLPFPAKLRACSCAPRPLLSSYVCLSSHPLYLVAAMRDTRLAVATARELFIRYGLGCVCVGSATGAVQGPDARHMYAAGSRFTPRSRSSLGAVPSRAATSRKSVVNAIKF